MRHSALVRVTHWITAASFIALVYSGIAILLAHPRLYWGETGALGTPSLIDLPLPFVLTGQSGWGRYLHFLSAWVCVLAGVVYVLGGMSACHFRNDLFRRRGPANYNGLQRITYTAVVFVLFLVGHVVMVYLAGFSRHVGAMILGGEGVVRETQT